MLFEISHMHHIVLEFKFYPNNQKLINQIKIIPISVLIIFSNNILKMF